jgi:TonB family protein
MAAMCWLGMAVGVVGAQSAKDAQKQFEKSVVGEELYLRNFSGETVVGAQWIGSAVEFDETHVRTMAMVVVEGVKVSRDRVEMRAKRYPVVKGGAGGATPGPEVTSVRLKVGLGGGDRAAAFAGLKDGLFFATYEDAMAALPKNRGGNGPRDDTALFKGGFNPRLAPERMCDCADRGTVACKGLVPAAGFAPLRVLHAVDPEFSEEARAKKVSGNVQVAMTVDSTGKVTDVWIVRPKGLGLDEKAVQAVRQYDIQPPACHGKGLATELYVEVNFQIF